MDMYRAGLCGPRGALSPPPPRLRRSAEASREGGRGALRVTGDAAQCGLHPHDAIVAPLPAPAAALVRFLLLAYPLARLDERLFAGEARLPLALLTRRHRVIDQCAPPLRRDRRTRKPHEWTGRRPCRLHGDRPERAERLDGVGKDRRRSHGPAIRPDEMLNEPAVL